jgi:hypothetical protein
MKDINVGPEWLEVARARFVARTYPPEDDWAAVNASDRGSFATFLGFTVTVTTLLAHGIGDTVLFVLTPDHCISLFPKLSVADFNRDPALLCSRAGRSAFPETEASFSEGEFRLRSPPHGWAGTYLVALTDALAEWVIRGEDDTARWLRLKHIASRTRDAFDTWIAEAIDTGQLRRDDCSALVIGL